MKKPAMAFGLFMASAACAAESGERAVSDPAPASVDAATTAAPQAGPGANISSATKSAHAFTFTGIAGDPLPLEQFSGRPVLVVNTASLCGFTDQYGGLQSLYETYEEDGLVVLGVPSNDFGGQEPGQAGEIKEFCETNFNVRFPLADKVVVKGNGAHPFYQWARETLGADNAPKWNFHKYLVGPEGGLVTAFPSAVEPMSAEVRRAVEAALSTSANTQGPTAPGE